MTTYTVYVGQFGIYNTKTWLADSGVLDLSIMLHLPQGNVGYMSQPASQASTQAKKKERKKSQIA